MAAAHARAPSATLDALTEAPSEVTSCCVRALWRARESSTPPNPPTTIRVSPLQRVPNLHATIPRAVRAPRACVTTDRPPPARVCCAHSLDMPKLLSPLNRCTRQKWPARWSASCPGSIPGRARSGRGRGRPSAAAAGCSVRKRRPPPTLRMRATHCAGCAVHLSALALDDRNASADVVASRAVSDVGDARANAAAVGNTAKTCASLSMSRARRCLSTSGNALNVSRCESLTTAHCSKPSWSVDSG